MTDRQAPPKAPARTPVEGIRGLDADELRLVQARERIRELIARLISAPIDPRTNEALRGYLEREAGPALEAFETLAARGPEQLRARIKEILAAPPGSLTAAPLTESGEET